MKILLIIISICISISCIGMSNSFCSFSNNISKNATKELPYNGKYHASFGYREFNVHYYSCKWEIDPTIRYIKGVVTTYYTPSEPLEQISFDLRDALRVDSVLQNQEHLSFSRRK